MPEVSIGHGRLQSLREELCRVVTQFYEHGWCVGTSGNFSVRIQADPLRLLMTRSGRNKRHFTAADLMVVGPDGNAAEGESGKPSAETLLHVALAGTAQAGAILHTHSVWNTLVGQHWCSQGGLTLHDFEMLKGLEGIRTHKTEVFVPIVENSQDMVAMAQDVRSLLAERPKLHGFLIAGHGLYTWGKTLELAERHVEIFEFLLECVGRQTRFEG